jgi:hypothetical protein
MNEPLYQPKVVGPFQLFLAKIAGTRHLYEEGGYRIECYTYKGVTYITSFQEPPQSFQQAH